ncbi:hypothetical protein EV182_007785 [Spiromyces aspiralis]|uniref:Uncharacterized protein n=1 Tax=Spiromyces aspiralis TaxID=68401 RepID=A0ACC1HJ89_9FUNG|nr:hypothetical protein EV182_007785 [Spiromyces aspiralis]
MLAYPDLKGLFVALNAPRLSEHWHIVLVSAAAAFAIQKLSIPISALALGPRFRALSGDKKHKWGIQLVSMLHALEASIMSLWVFEDESLRQDPVYGFSYTAERIYAVSMG